MINIKTLKQRINLLEYIQKTLKSVESININKRAVLKKQHQIFEEIVYVFGHLINLSNYQEKDKCLLIIGSDSSLCGSYNSSIIKFFKNHSIKSNYKAIYIIGKKIKKLFINHPHVIYCNYKDFFKNNLQQLYDNHGFNINILGYHSKILDYWSIKNDFKAILQKNKIIDDFIKEIHSNSIDFIVFQYLIMKVIYNIENQENNQRLMFLKNAIENCQEEIQENMKIYRSLRQENITREINELIASRCN